MKKFFLYRAIIVGILVVVGIAFSFFHFVMTTPGDVMIDLLGPRGEHVSIAVEIADDTDEKTRGLMFRQYLDNGSGMLFIFNEPQALAFWMKNTFLPLDILFFDGQGAFVSRTTMDPCDTEQCPTYPSEGMAKYALEVNRGEALTEQVVDGWQIDLSGLYQ